MSSQEQQVLDNDATAAEARFTIHLRNSTESNDVYAYVKGIDIARDHYFLLRADGKTPYFPANVEGTGKKLAHDCAIKLGGPGTETPIHVPHLQSARVFFAIGNKLHFELNHNDASTPKGAQIAEPSVSNTSLANYHVHWGFAEFTWNHTQMFANISFVDFVGPPIALTMHDDGKTQHVTGMPANGVAQVCEKLHHVASGPDHKDWAKLAIKSKSGGWLRALSPDNGQIVHPGLFKGYYGGYVDKVWNKYKDYKLHVNTQNADYGKLQGEVKDGHFVIGGEKFGKPDTADIFSCNTGPFTPSSDAKRSAIIPRLAAGFNRSTLLEDNKTPDPDGREDYYKYPVTNHYSKIVHSVATDGLGYGFAYDDVHPTGKKPQEGKVVSTGKPKSLIITVGGK